MSMVKKISTVVVAAISIMFITISAALPALAGNTTTGVQAFDLNLSIQEVILPNNGISENDSAVAGEELRRSTIVEKLVCRYIDGQKRCWHE